MENKKKELLKDINKLIGYGKNDNIINPALLKYLNIDDLDSIKKSLLNKVGNLSNDNKEWLKQFKN